MLFANNTKVTPPIATIVEFKDQAFEAANKVVMEARIAEGRAWVERDFGKFAGDIRIRIDEKSLVSCVVSIAKNTRGAWATKLLGPKKVASPAGIHMFLGRSGLTVDAIAHEFMHVWCRHERLNLPHLIEECVALQAFQPPQLPFHFHRHLRWASEHCTTLDQLTFLLNKSEKPSLSAAWAIVDHLHKDQGEPYPSILRRKKFPKVKDVLEPVLRRYPDDGRWSLGRPSSSYGRVFPRDEAQAAF